MAFLKSISLNYKDILITEIALDGLQGIGFNLLWKRVEKCLNTPVTTKQKGRYWDFIKNYRSIEFYLQKQPLPEVEILDRFSIIDENTGHILDPPDFVDGPYEYCPVDGQYGSCTNFDERESLSVSEIEKISYEEVEAKYGNRLVMVASIEERWRALASNLPISYLTMMTPIHYCMLELIGRARENGQITVGKTNLTKIINESKLLFYNRKHLLKLNLISVVFITQVVAGRSMKTLLLRTKKFHKPLLLSLPKSGKIHEMVEYLLKQPDYCERTDMVIKKGLLTSKQSKRLQKTFNIFSFEEKAIETTSKKGPAYVMRRKFVCLNPGSDDDETDDEDQEPPLKCTYKVGVGLLRQAYERFLDAGQSGLTQIELAQLLGVEFYTSRSICRIFRDRKIIREFLEDKGRQRTARFIAITAQNLDEMDEKYAVEKKKFLNHLNDTKKAVKSSKKRSAEESSESTSKVPKKKVKHNEEESMDNAIVETNSLTGIETMQGSIINAKKDLTLKQLMFANGTLKVIKERQFVIGFQTLGSLVSKEIGQPPMDTKAMKLFIQKLAFDKQLKILKLKWPGSDNRYSYLICAQHIKATDPIIKAKYKEICLKAEEKEKSKSDKEKTQPLAKVTYPRYMKVQKLHELIMQSVYFNEVKNEGLPTGFSTLFSIIPEITVEYAIGSIAFVAKVDKETLGMKLKDAPAEVQKPLLQSTKLQNSVCHSLKMLATLGLIQVIEKPTPSLFKKNTVLFYVFYVNRHAKILDTHGKWPRCEDLKALERSFSFETMEDVHHYWDEVRNISLNTIVTVNERERPKMYFPMREETEVEEHDNGQRYGDGMGPCGFDSSIFMDMPRLWNKYFTRNKKKTLGGGPKKVPKVVKRRVKKKVVRKSKVKLETIKREPGERVKGTGSAPRRKDFTWNTLEDKILTLCKVAVKIISPTTQAGSLMIRNYVARDLLSLIDPTKTVTAIIRRGTVLDSNSIWKHWKERVLCELKRRRGSIKDYEGLLTKNRVYNQGNILKLVNEMRLPMLELIWLILQMEKNKGIRDEYECIARSIDDFNKQYSIELSTPAQDVNVYKTPPSQEMQFGMLKELIMTIVMLSNDDGIPKNLAHKIYSLLKTYPEKVLRDAIEQLRKGGAIVIREKSSYFHNRETFDKLSHSAFKVSAMYRRKWTSKLMKEFFRDLSQLLNSELPTFGLKGRSELNCLLFELQNSDAIDIFSDSVPVVVGSAGSILLEDQINVADVDTKYKLKSGYIGWKNKMNVKLFSDLYKKVDKDDLIRTISRDSIVTIKNVDYDKNDGILSYLDGIGFKGCSFKELKDHLSIDAKELSEKLSELSSKGIIRTVGYFQNIIMLAKYTKPFLQKISPDTYLEPAPWLNLEGQVQENVFFQWATVVVNKIFESPGINISTISDHFDCISSRSVLNICMFLEKCECMILKTLQPKEIDLFSDDDCALEDGDFNPYYSFEDIYVYPDKNCLTKFALILPQEP
ncbi:uncharacterized protein LOC121737304 [Aricia agestis]|uniref:uncharacterized protein LOC121737304 n=1 Tax=Aricia agestis TaxID=91739 RepID=UPI001C2098C2|nr:uncharacterized protein LOC121737304 [Aricia agestis]